jgi:type I restriction enzyme R subunit
LFVAAGWRRDAIWREYPLGISEVPRSEARMLHHGAREDRVSFVLCARPGVPTAAVATVGTHREPESGLTRAIRQAQLLDAPLAYVTNGEETVEHYVASRHTVAVPIFTTPSKNWRLFANSHRLLSRGSRLLTQRFDLGLLAAAGMDGPRAETGRLRYYELVAVNRALMAYSRDERRASLRIAPGAGATVTALSFIGKLLTYQLTMRPGEPFTALYLDDRSEAMTGLGALGATGRWGADGEVSLALRRVEEDLGGIDRADLVVINLAHGDAALEPGAWTAAAERFPEAFLLGVIGAEPGIGSEFLGRFGSPVYRYTARHGVADGYLRPPALG